MGNHFSVQYNNAGRGNLRSRRQSWEYLKSTFFLSLSCEHIQVVNASNKVLLLISSLVRSHCTVLYEGWLRMMTYSFTVNLASRSCMIKLMSHMLFSLYQDGWDPLSPVDVGRKTSKKQTAICFQRRTKQVVFRPIKSLPDMENSCFCLELYQWRHMYLIFHSVPYSVVAELIAALGVSGVSTAVNSVISDYTLTQYPVLPPGLCQGAEKYVRLTRQPARETVEVSTIACLAKCGFKLSLPINLDKSTKMFFCIFEEENRVRQETRGVAGTGMKDHLTIHRPIITRSRSSFFRSFHARESLNKRIRRSLKKKVGREWMKTSKTKPAWFQQTSCDIGTDYSDSDEEQDK